MKEQGKEKVPNAFLKYKVWSPVSSSLSLQPCLGPVGYSCDGPKYWLNVFDHPGSNLIFVITLY